MFFPSGKALAAAALLGALPIQAVPYPFVLEKRTCNADNLLRLLRTPSNLPQALPFCSTYLGLPVSTITVSTVTPTVTSYTTEVAIETALFTENPVVSLTLTTTETSVVVQTTTITVTPQQITAREIGRRCSSSTTTTRASTTSRVTTTKYTTPLAEQVTGATYPPSRISSACSCLTIPIEISSVTATAPEVTEVITVPSTSSTSETVTITLTELASTTETTTIFSTVTETSTKLEPTAYALKVSAPGTADDGKFVMNRNESPNNNGPDAAQSFPITPFLTYATKFVLQPSPDRTLRIVTSSTLYASSVVGQVSADWIHWDNPMDGARPLYSSKRATVLNCGTCTIVRWQINPLTGRLTSINNAKAIGICNLPIPAYGRGIYLGTLTAPSAGCIFASLYVVPLY